MAKKKIIRRKAPARVRASQTLADASAPLRRKAWTFLIYMCGDDDVLERFIDEDFAEMCRVGSQPDVHVVVQRDRREGARRYVLPEGPSDEKKLAADKTLDKVRVNTGEPAEALKFFLWGIERAPSQRVALIFSGLGISPQYVRQQSSAEAGSSDDSKEVAQRKLFSFCHDQTSRDDLEAHELREILRQVKDKLGEERVVDVVGFDLGAGAFVEIAYQMEGLAEIFVASQGLLPNAGWPYGDLITQSQKLIARQQASIATPKSQPAEIGKLWVNAVIGKYDKLRDKLQMVAVNLGALPGVGRALDTLSLSLMQSLGDWHVLDAVQKALENTEWIRAEEPDEPTAKPSPMLPAVDLLLLLEQLGKTFAAKLEEVPAAYGQRDRIKQLSELAGKALDVIRSADAQGALEPLILYSAPRPGQGLSIVIPPPNPQKTKANEFSFNLADSNYIDLRFSQTVHWAALVGAFQLITDKPYVLWRLISSILADAGGGARDALLARMISPDSLVQGMKEQFQILSPGAGLTLSLEPKEVLADGETAPEGEEARTYRLRLESSIAGATVKQHESRVYQTTIDTSLRGLEELLTSVEDNLDVKGNLEALGRALGEDLIQDLATDLNAERFEEAGGSEAVSPHLRLQIPTELMRYPWELMHDRHGMLCERFAMGRQVFMPSRWTRRLTKRKTGPIRVLVIGDPQFTEEYLAKCQKQTPPWRPAQLRGAQQEAGLVADAFEQLAIELAGLPPLEVKRLIGAKLTVNDFRQCLRAGEYDIIHYAGHACFNQKDPEGSGWLLSDGLLHAREIRNTLAWIDSPPWLVFANACEAGMDARTPAAAYQGDIFGLATAFINQAVAAYIGPLWPVDDVVAAQLAIDFYRALLLERVSLGEALRRAKVLAKGDLLPLSSEAGEMPLPPRVALSWASMVLYGDPTPRLLEALWTPQSQVDEKGEREIKPAVAGVRAVSSGTAAPRLHFRRVAQAKADETRALVSGPGMVPTIPGAMRGAGDMPPGMAGIELVEVNGIRVWKLIDPKTGERKPLPGSELYAAAVKEEVRGVLGHQRGWKDYFRVVGSWIVNKVTGADSRSLLLRLVEQYDKDTVAAEGLLLIEPGQRLQPVPRPPERWGWLDIPPSPGQADRVLLIVHGTFSQTASPVAGLGEEFLAWARKKYRAVIGFDHWTLSKTPEENARELWEKLDPRLRTGHKLDIITHSRGGLVARALVELLNHAEGVRHVVFVGTPNCGTNLANPDNWGRAADVLVNLIHTDPTGVYGKLSGFLVQMIANGALGEIPGLQAQNPAATGAVEFLIKLQKKGVLSAEVSYSAVSANYEPSREDFNLKRLLAEAGDTTLDGLYPGPNDLVVDTAHVWAIDGEAGFAAINLPLKPESVLLFNPDPKVIAPPGVKVEMLSGVHHTNLFTWEATRAFLRQQLAQE